MRATRLLPVLAALVAAVGCGGEEAAGGGTPASSRALSDRLVDLSKKPPYVNALDVDPATGDYLMTTNRGFWRIDPESDTVEPLKGTVTADGGSSPVGTFLEVMVTGPDALLGSGHPDSKKELPPYLGLMSSEDGGATWEVISRLGEADLHKIVLRHDRLYAIDAVLGAVLVSDDGGRTFAEHLTPLDEVFIDLEVDPGDPDILVGSNETQLYRSQDSGKTWRPLDVSDGIRLVWTAPDAFFRADRDGTVYRSRDGGLRLDEVGTVPGEPYKFKALDTEHLLLALSDGTVVETEGRRQDVGGDVPAMRRLLCLAAAAALLVPATASAHSLVRIGGDAVRYQSADATSLNTLAVRLDGDRIDLSDRTVDGGIDPGPCDVGDDQRADLGSSRPSARARHAASLNLDLGEREDSATVDVPLPVVLLGGPGADTLRTGGVRRPAARRRRQRRPRRRRRRTTSWTAGSASTCCPAATATTCCGTPTDCRTGSSAARATTASRPTRRTPSPATASRSPPAVAPPPDVAARTTRRRRSSASGGPTLQRLRPRPRPPARHDQRARARSPPRARSTSPGISLPVQADRKRVDRGRRRRRLVIRLTRRHLRLCRRVRSPAAGARASACSPSEPTSRATRRRAKPIRIRLRR